MTTPNPTISLKNSNIESVTKGTPNTDNAMILVEDVKNVTRSGNTLTVDVNYQNGPTIIVFKNEKDASVEFERIAGIRKLLANKARLAGRVLRGSFDGGNIIDLVFSINGNVYGIENDFSTYLVSYHGVEFTLDGNKLKFNDGIGSHEFVFEDEYKARMILAISQIPLVDLFTMEEENAIATRDVHVNGRPERLSVFVDSEIGKIVAFTSDGAVHILGLFGSLGVSRTNSDSKLQFEDTLIFSGAVVDFQDMQTASFIEEIFNHEVSIFHG